jgi:hypothetical protein
MHGVDTVEDGLALLDVDWGFPVRTAAYGEGSVFDGDAEVKRDRGEEAEDCGMVSLV